MNHEFNVGDWVLFPKSDNKVIGRITESSFGYYRVSFNSNRVINQLTAQYFEINCVTKLSEGEVMIRMLEN